MSLKPTRVSKKLLAIVPLILVGCQTTHPLATNSRQPVAVRIETSKNGYGPLAAFDPCGDRLEDLCGPLLLYFKAKQHGPAKIEELQQYALSGVPLQLVCPVSGKPYLCAPQGLEAPGEKIRIYLYDAEPVHAGERWCAMIKIGATAGADGFFSDHIPEARFQHFLTSSGQQPALQQ